MVRKKLIRRLKWYYPLEKFHALITLPSIIFFLIFTYPLLQLMLLLYGLLVCMIILYQGQCYWKIKLYSISGKSFDQNKYLLFFKKSKKINELMIFCMPAVFVLQLIIQDWGFWYISIYWGIIANVFAILEYVNYFRVQLMIDNFNDLKYLFRYQRFKKASLMKDLVENKL